MAERPILFSGPMVQAILNGRKTQTRRVLKPGATVRWASEDDHVISSPYGAPDDLLWVREAGWHDKTRGRWFFDDGWCVSSDGLINGMAPGRPSPERFRSCGLKRKPSIYMPRWASRLTLLVTAVRVQRLQEITPNDAIAEGVFHAGTYTTEPGMSYPVATMKSLWDSINGKRAPWSSNPWVWAITFKRLASKL